MSRGNCKPATPPHHTVPGRSDITHASAGRRRMRMLRHIQPVRLVSTFWISLHVLRSRYPAGMRIATREHGYDL